MTNLLQNIANLLDWLHNWGPPVFVWWDQWIQMSMGRTYYAMQSSWESDLIYFDYDIYVHNWVQKITNDDVQLFEL